MFTKETQIDEIVKVTLICKGYYDKKKYTTIVDALKQYYAQEYFYGDPEKYGYSNWEKIGEEFLLNRLLNGVIQDLAKYYPDRMYNLIKLYVCGSASLVKDEIWFGNYEKALFYRIVSFLANLRMRGERVKEINTDKYLMWDKEFGINKLIKPIIK